MTSVFSWQNCQPLPCFILYSKAIHACYTRYLLTSYFCTAVPYDEKDICFWCYFCRSQGFPGGSEVKASACNVGDLGSIPGLRRSPGEGNGNPLQYSCLANPMDRGAWWATLHRVAKSWTRLSDFTFWRSCRSSQTHSTLTSSAIVVGAQIWITLLLHGFPWK